MKEDITIHFIDCKTIHADLGVSCSPCRGYSYGKDVFVCEDHYDLALIAHEVGHSLGETHSIWFGIMNPTGALRWFMNPLKAIWKILNHFRKR